MLSPASLDRIAASPGWRRHRIEVIDLPEGRVVVKGQRPPRSAARFWLMRLLARWTHNPLLRPVPAPGGAAGQATEARRLRELAVAARLPGPVRERIDDAARRLAWLRHLPSRRDPWGRDVVSLQALAAFLAEEQRFHSASQ
ncbi:hypothetical protein [Tepidimonas taiwanensis]|uniref:hypothetical protein n=1 Tax=Tepidimonas taiwanensis TaxID=307486 RepID=UPI0005BE370B|nr:hypothetical protein [Tepidimonas taiwanensis]